MNTETQPGNGNNGAVTVTQSEATFAVNELCELLGVIGNEPADILWRYIAQQPAQPVGEFDKRGGSLWLDREQWGIVMDALIEHCDSATKRKGANEASNSDARAETCLDVIGMIGAACAAPALPNPQPDESAQGGD